jgi:hypothetical protein
MTGASEEREDFMMLQLSGDFQIEDRWHHSPEAIDELRSLLFAGAEAAADSRRRDFYEIEHDGRVFYIHLCPNGKVLLLAIWSVDHLQVAQAQASFRVTSSW